MNQIHNALKAFILFFVMTAVFVASCGCSKTEETANSMPEGIVLPSELSELFCGGWSEDPTLNSTDLDVKEDGTAIITVNDVDIETEYIYTNYSETSNSFSFALIHSGKPFAKGVVDYASNPTLTLTLASDESTTFELYKIDKSETVDNEPYTNSEQTGREGEDFVLMDGKMVVNLSTDAYDVFTQNNPIDSVSLQRQGIEKELADQYMQLGGYALHAVPVGEQIGNPTTRVTVNIKDKKYEGVENLKDLSAGEKTILAMALVRGFNSEDYDWHVTDKTEYIVFDCDMIGREIRYATVIDERMIYIYISKYNNELTEKDRETIKKIVDGITWNL